MTILDKITLFLLHQTKGPVAERLGRALQKLVHQFDSGRDLKRRHIFLKASTAVPCLTASSRQGIRSGPQKKADFLKASTAVPCLTVSSRQGFWSGPQKKANFFESFYSSSLPDCVKQAGNLVGTSLKVKFVRHLHLTFFID